MSNGSQRSAVPKPSPGRIQAFSFIGILSTVILAFLVWLVYGAPPTAAAPTWIQTLPLSDACFNAASALLALAGVAAIKQGQRTLHKGLMAVALLLSGLFLGGYITFHHFHGETHFGGQGLVRIFYFSVLILHLLFSAVVLPMLLAVIWFALVGDFNFHKKLARWTYPLWVFVSISGVLVYWMLRPYY